MTTISPPETPDHENTAPLLQELDTIVGFHIRLAHGAVYRHFSETFSGLDLTQKQVSVLWLIHDYHAIGQARLGRILQMDRATVMAIVNRLEKRDFVVRKASQTDKRRQTLHMTEQGTSIFAKAKEAIAEHEKWLKDRFNKKEVAQLINLLRRIHQ